MDFPYLARVTALNIAVAGRLAAAPPAPASATLGGAVSSDTTVTWTPVKGASAYFIYTRRADEKDWKAVTRTTDTKHTLKGVIVDDHFVGVTALSADGTTESIITFAGLPPRS